MKKIISLINLQRELSLCLVTFFISFSHCLCQNAFQGPDSPSSSVEQSFGCLGCPGSEWVNPANIKAHDGQYAKSGMSQYPQCFQTSCFHTRSLLAQGFGFTIPANSVITGIKTEVLKISNIDSMSDYQVRLLQNGDTVGVNKANPAFWSLSSLGYAPYGDSTDTWGVNWTAAQIDSSAFGLAFRVQNDKTVTSHDTAYIDHIRITVYFTTPTGLPALQSSDNNFSVFFNHEEQAIIIRRSPYASPVSEITIYNILGKKVFNESFANTGMSSTEEIRNLNLREGIYLVELKGAATASCRKLLITQ